MVKSVEPISVHMEVNVSLPTTMWCEGVLRGSQIHPGSVRSSREGLLVTNSSIILVSGLEPNTDYDIYCFGSSQYGEITQSMLSTMKRIHTDRGKVEISGITLSDHTISYRVESNILLTAVCTLFDVNMIRIDSMKTSLISTKPIFFTGVDLSQKYTTQCVVIAGNREVMRTELVPIQSKRYWTRRFLLSVLAILTAM
ncbi:hypothetical protein WA588_002851 [Blastocystis sp. NMH]